MADFVNYYEEFSIPKDASLDQIKALLKKERQKWNLRQNNADLSKRQDAERKLLLLDDAAEVFQDDYTKDVYDRKVSKNGNSQTQTRTDEYNGSGNSSNIEEVVLRIKKVYDTGNNDAVIDYCNRALDAGHKDCRIYDYLCAAYEESNKTDMALATAKTALSVTNHNWFKYLIAKYDVYYFNNINEAKQLIDELKNSSVDAASAMALSVEIELRLGNEQNALSQVDDYLASHPNDNQYKQQVASAYLRYSDLFLTTANDGYLYWNSRDDYQNSVKYRKMAYDLYPNDQTREIYDRIVSFDKKQFDKEDLIGPIAIGVIGFVMLTGGLPFFGIILLALFGWIMYSKNAAQWENERDDHSGSRSLPKQIARISTNLAKIFGRIILFILRLINEIIIHSV